MRRLAGAGLLAIMLAVTLAAWVRPAAAAPGPVAGEPEGVLTVARWAALQPELERQPRIWLVWHTVSAGESIWSIADGYGLDLDTLRWSNPALVHNPDIISPGQKLLILPVPGIYHTVQAGETVDDLAKKYGVAPDDIRSYRLNHLKPPYRLSEGQKLVIPFGRKLTAWAKPSLAPDYPFAWPAAGAVSQGFSSNHAAIDVAVGYDSPVYAARDGRVSRVDWDDSGYWGFWVVIDHGEGLLSYYAHLKGATVVVGQWVERGLEIGRMGSTGNSTGPHVHFEIRQSGVRMNPLDYLPPGP
jgi:LysM repeat protein